MARLTLVLSIAVLALAGAREASARTGCPDPKPYGCKDMAHNPPPPGNLDGVSGLRRAIIDAAARNIGQVSAIDNHFGHKCGWPRLTEFYNTVYQQPLKPEDYATIKRAMTISTVADPAHPDPSDPHHFKAVVNQEKFNDWCGIFALWAVKTGAKTAFPAACTQCTGQNPPDAHGVSAAAAAAIQDTWWKPEAYGWGVSGLPLVQGHRGIQPGDIVYFKGKLQHQAIVERVVGGKLYTIDGNQECQQIGRRVSDLSSVQGYYRVE